ncbi:unnamed protein product [Mytilus edulis]|uniref:Uncharacterized protein n=1 Tax=Mytilus edulis TaxID=6550 RepID=A0A8S3TT25_MYTED|nr:unnamed protein product [Mytilus edulis]
MTPPKESDRLKILEYIGLLVLWEAIDMVTDWVLYTDVKSIEPGLVYGPPDDTLVPEFRILIEAEIQSKFIVIKSTGKDPFPKFSECFHLLDNEIKIITPCSNFFTTFYTFALRFEFRERDIPSLLLGDVNYNWKTDINGNCSQNIGNETYIPSVHYYRSKSNVDTSHHLNWDKRGIRFFNNDDLIDVRYIWKTSFSSCQSNGRSSPHLDNGIRLNCA